MMSETGLHRNSLEEIRILHVDDDPHFTDLVVTFLQREDEAFHVETASSASDGLDRLADADFDCIVSDYDIPGRSGIEFLRTVRESYPDVPFILFTGKGSEEIASDAIGAGATDYLQKGSGTDQYELLANRIRNAVAQYQSERARQRVVELAEHTDRVLFSFTRDWSDLLFVSSAYEDLWGRSVAALRDDPTDFLAGVHPDDRDLVRDALDTVSDGDAVEIEFRVNAEEDYRRWVRARGEPIVDETGDVIRVSGIVAEVTEDHRRQERRERQRETLVDLATRESVTNGDLETAVREITETAAEVLDVDRANVWFIDGDDGEEVLTCVDHYDRRSDEHTRGMTLAIDEYPTYFEALESHQAIDAVDAREDPRTAELAGEYLEPRDIGALLDGTLRSEGEVIGVVCHEHVGDPREWADDEVHFAGQVADIVHRALRNEERAEQRREMAFQRSLLEAQQEATIDGVLVVDDDGEIISYNDRFVELWGIPEEVVESGDDGAALEWAMDQLVDPAEFRERVEYLYEHPTRTSRDEIELSDGRVFDRYSAPVIDDGTYFGRLWTFRDVTEQREREEELRRTTARLEALFEESPDMINVHDTDGNIIDPNPRLAEKTGYDPSELADMKVWDLDRAIGPEEAYALWEDMEVGESRRLEGIYRRREGSTFPVEVHIRRLRLEGEDRFIAIARDVSERKERERELEHERDRLDEFASVVSHDLRNPLNVARGHLELAREECDSECLDAIEQAHDRMRTLVDDLLVLARAEQNVAETEPVNLGTASQQCWTTVETGDATLVIDTHRTVDADESRLKQVLENLVRNAIEHGGGDVTVTVGDLDDGFYVEDDGPGIPEDERDDVFDAGYSTSEGGTGFGLSIVEQVVQAHDWTVRVTEGSAGGARFEITGVEFVST